MARRREHSCLLSFTCRESGSTASASLTKAHECGSLIGKDYGNTERRGVNVLVRIECEVHCRQCPDRVYRSNGGRTGSGAAEGGAAGFLVEPGRVGPRQRRRARAPAPSAPPP